METKRIILGLATGLAAVTERRIQEVIERGEFGDLPGKGKPLDLGEDDRTVPAELKMA